MKYKCIILFIISIITISVINSCRVNKELISDEDGFVKTPQIIFLNYSIIRNLDGKNEIRFINKIIANGKLKKDTPKDQVYKEGDLKCVQLDKNMQPVKSVYLPNPSVNTVEYVNELEQLSKKEIELDSARFSIRMQLDPQTKYIAIEKIKKITGESIGLIVTKIK